MASFHSAMPSSSSSLSGVSSQSPLLHLRPQLHHHASRLSALPFSRALPPPLLRLRIPRPLLPTPPLAFSHGGGGDNDDDDNNNGGGDGEGDGGDGDVPDNRREALFVLAQLGRKLESLPSDLAAAVEGGRVTGEIVRRFAEMEGSALLRWLLQFQGFRERLLADDLFLAKLAMECGVGVIAKTAAEYEKRRENFVKEIDIVIADVVMAIVADFMLVYLPAPTVSLQPPLATNAGHIANFFHNCPDNAFQIALAGRSYSLLQRLGAILRNGAKLFTVGTSASLIGTGVTNALIKARKAVDKELDDEVEDIPVLSTSVAYGVYMAVSSNLRYQILAGVIEQRMLEPILHNHKLLLSALCFAVRTGNTFLGSLLWVDYARWDYHAFYFHLWGLLTALCRSLLMYCLIKDSGGERQERARVVGGWAPWSRSRGRLVASLDFFFASRSHAARLVDLVTSLSPALVVASKQLASASHDTRHTFAVELCPVCRDDLVFLPKEASRDLGGLGPIVLCVKVTNALALLDTSTLRVVHLGIKEYDRCRLEPALTSRQLVEYVVLDVDHEPAAGDGVAYAQVARASDLGKNDTIFTVRTHLGHVLNAGDHALGYDLYGANVNNHDVESHGLPDAVLVKKIYEKGSRRKLQDGGGWKRDGDEMEEIAMGIGCIDLNPPDEKELAELLEDLTI
uniref:Uncharacterized protein n=1 Tax=Oryza glumipatula TaxID=40148 RepID=A0A0D9YK74_9ORYZ